MQCPLFKDTHRLSGIIEPQEENFCILVGQSQLCENVLHFDEVEREMISLATLSSYISTSTALHALLLTQNQLTMNILAMLL